MTLQFRPAVRDRTALTLGIAGPSRSGKTYSALRIATGLAQGGPIYVIDTESGRALQYADTFKFLHARLNPPFSSAAYEAALLDAQKAGAAVIIVDSASHEHEGPGGILEQHETELQRMAGDDYQKRERMKFTAWIKPKAAHNRYVNTMLQINTHMIFCFRAKDKLELARGSSGKTEPTHVGWTPICTDRFEYEMTAMLVLPEGANGVPDLAAKSTGLRSPLDTMIRPGQPLDEGLGERLAAWAKGQGGSAPGPATAPDPLEAARAAAEGGKDALQAWWRAQGQAVRRQVQPHMEALKETAVAADTPPADGGGDELFRETPETGGPAIAEPEPAGSTAPEAPAAPVAGSRAPSEPEAAPGGPAAPPSEPRAEAASGSLPLDEPAVGEDWRTVLDDADCDLAGAADGRMLDEIADTYDRRFHGAPGAVLAAYRGMKARAQERVTGKKARG